MEIDVSEFSLVADFRPAFELQFVFGKAESVLEADGAFGAVGEDSLGTVSRVDVAGDQSGRASAASVAGCGEGWG